MKETAATAGAEVRVHAATGLTDKVAALSSADFYGDAERWTNDRRGVTCIETHMSWVFLTRQYAYKLKKPVCLSYLDFSTLDARLHYCREELRLNRRLAPSVYLDVVPLRSNAGRLQLGGRSESDGEIVDYLIKMVRLPSEKMLDRAIAAQTLHRSDLRAVAQVLAAFYRQTAAMAMTPAHYRARFSAAIDANRRQLSAAHYGLPHARIAQIAAAQLDYVATADELAARAAHVVDAHGDLRPEHIYLGMPPQIIDCLEFQDELRQLDPFDELSFLALECARLGAPRAGNALLRMYRILSKDDASPRLIAFYQSHRAMVRAVLAIWHVDDPSVRDRERWCQRARAYIDIAGRALDKALPLGIASTGDKR